MQNEMLCVSGCPKPSSKTLTLTITNKSHQIIPSFTFYILHFILDHPIIRSKQPFLTHFWEVEQVPTTQSHRKSAVYGKRADLGGRRIIKSVIYNPQTIYKSYVRCKMKCCVCFRVSQTLKQYTHSNHHK